MDEDRPVFSAASRSGRGLGRLAALPKVDPERVAAERRPDLVILDLGLPDISGYAVAETLRRDPAYDRTLIIAATGYGQEKDRQRSRQAGSDHHLVKPFHLEQLQALLQKLAR